MVRALTSSIIRKYTLLDEKCDRVGDFNKLIITKKATVFAYRMYTGTSHALKSAWPPEQVCWPAPASCCCLAASGLRG